MTAKVYYSWTDYSLDMNKLKSEVEKYDYDLVVGIARGGLIPATELSHHLGIPLVVLFWQLRDGEAPTELPFDVRKQIAGKKILFVDDICDSGETMAQIVKSLYNTKYCLADDYDVVCLHHNLGQNIFTPDFYVNEINKSIDPVWLVYPWEKRDD